MTDDEFRMTDKNKKSLWVKLISIGIYWLKGKWKKEEGK